MFAAFVVFTVSAVFVNEVFVADTARATSLLEFVIVPPAVETYAHPKNDGPRYTQNNYIY